MNNLKEIVDKLFYQTISELNEGVNDDLYKEAYINRINNERKNMLEKVVNNPNFVFLLNKDVEHRNIGESNKCETNVFQFIKENPNYYPVGGFTFNSKSLFPIEHYWIYDKQRNKHIDITPVSDETWAYGGVINSDINNQIVKAKNVYDISFFKGGEVYFKYFK